MAQLTQRQLLQLLKNREYWRDREAQQRATYIRTEEEELKEVNRIYDEMYAWAVKEIDAFYGKYATAEGIDITEAKKRVSQLDIEEYQKLAKEYVKDKNFSDQANAEMRLYNATMKSNRLELLKAQIGLHLVSGFDEIDKHYHKIATDRAVQELERMSGILGNTLTQTETAKTAKQIVNADFYNATFSERIWSAQDYLKDALATELQKGFISGIGSREMARRLKEHAFDKSYSDALRLARTELRRIQTDVAKDNYERNGIDQYEFMAVNPNACPICRKMDGDIYNVRDMEAGLNAPPIHPNCHCTTAPHFDDTEYEAWLNFLEQGGTTAEWNEMSPAKRQRWLDSVIQSTPKANVEDRTAEAKGFIPATNIQEAEAYAKSIGFEAHYKGVSLKTANAMNESFKRGVDFCSKIKDRMKMVGSGQETNKLLKKHCEDWYKARYGEYGAKAWASSCVGRIASNTYAFARDMSGAGNIAGAERFGGIFVNNVWADYDKMTNALKNDVKKGFHPVGCDTVKSVFDHEMGHQLDYALDLSNDKELTKYYKTLTKTDIQNGLSQYANKNKKEFIAEAYAEYLNNPEPRPIAKTVGDIIAERAKGS